MHEFPSFYASRIFSTVFIKARQISRVLSYINPEQKFKSHFFSIHFNIILQSTPRFSKRSLSSGFPITNLHPFIFLPCMPFHPFFFSPFDCLHYASCKYISLNEPTLIHLISLNLICTTRFRASTHNHQGLRILLLQKKNTLWFMVAFRLSAFHALHLCFH